MRKSFFYKKMLLVLAVFTAVVYVSCKDDNTSNFKAGREVFMSNDVRFQIIFPDAGDTLFYKDSLTGFSVILKEGTMAFYPNTFEDTLTFRKEKKEIKLVYEPKNFYILDAGSDGTRHLGFEGEAVLYMKKYREPIMNTIPLQVIPVVGTIKKDVLNLWEADSSLTSGKQPFLNLRYKGKLISD